MEQNVIKEKGHAANFHKLLPSSGMKRNSKKRRKVNHACVYCRRSERPCARCIKRNIGHLCHDEPREFVSTTKKTKYLHNQSKIEDDKPCQDQIQVDTDNGMNSSFKTSQDFSQDNLSIGSTVLPQSSLHIIQQSPRVRIPMNSISEESNQYIEYLSDWSKAQSTQFHKMQNYHPLYMFNAPEVTNECNLLNDFLNNNLRDDGFLLQGDIANLYDDQVDGILPDCMINPNNQSNSQDLEPLTMGGNSRNLISRPPSVIPTDKAREYYLQAADPSGNDAPEERIQRLFQAKYDAGMLKPFNYVKGYARLSAYMENHLQHTQKLKILKQIEQFQPKFRENIQTLTDIELIYAEMWFERSLMEYDRVFASMAIPACCWRRTGEIFRGNKEMAELINVPTESLRDGKIALHEILADESLVNYWEKFGAIAFDQSQKALLTSCFLKSPNDKSKASAIKCCFSFCIRRDEFKMLAYSTTLLNPCSQVPVRHLS